MQGSYSCDADNTFLPCNMSSSIHKKFPLFLWLFLYLTLFFRSFSASKQNYMKIFLWKIFKGNFMREWVLVKGKINRGLKIPFYCVFNCARIFHAEFIFPCELIKIYFPVCFKEYFYRPREIITFMCWADNIPDNKYFVKTRRLILENSSFVIRLL